ncbi:MAG TPA: alpha/beta fold hydrolase [Chthoniobacterales bacterium]|nr:alpha/beta fold hydrolase [Chthoniobacterales bacterium]
MNARSLLLSFLFPAALIAAEPTNKTLTPPDSLVLDGVPPIPAEIAEEVGRYTESRAAAFLDWHPEKSEMLILTRFGQTNQVHLVSQPGGARTQFTFFDDRVTSASFDPKAGAFFLFSKSAGGNEFDQNYRYDFATGALTLLTDGKSRNSPPVWSHDGTHVAYTSTRRNGADTDLYLESPDDPKSERLLAEVKGGGWEVEDWSPDGTQLLALEEISINESYLWLFDTKTGERTELTPRPAEGAPKVSYSKALFAKDGRGIFVTTDRDSEFQRLAYLELASKAHTWLAPDAKHDVDSWDLSGDGARIAYTLNENGVSALHVIGLAINDGKMTATAQPDPAFDPPISSAVISALKWQRGDGRNELAFNVNSARSPSDAYTWAPDAAGNTASRWTTSETGGIPAERFVEPKLVSWKSFDGREITGFLYQPNPEKFPGPRPVIVNIHGGPESQARPGFAGRNNYLFNELGCAMILPNVRGSAGYGKSYLLLDNGLKREDSYKDISALLDWIKTQPQLDAGRVMAYGGSYGGFMTLQVATNFADRIRCAIDIVGISNLATFLKNTESYRRDLRRAEYGDERDPKMAAFMEKIAALNNAEKITKPLLVVQGANDPRVPRSEAEQIVAILKKRKTPVWYMLGKDEGHGFQKKKNADYLFYATVQFIRDYLLK